MTDKTIKVGTFMQSDYISLGPYCWGRGATPKAAWQAMKSAFPSQLVKPNAECVLLRLTDANDDIRIDDFGNLNIDSGEAPFLCGRFRAQLRVSDLLDAYPVPEQLKA